MINEHQKPTPEQPPANTRWIFSRRDLPQTRDHCLYTVAKPDGTTRQAVLGKRNRQVIEALKRSPIYAASPIRLSDTVGILRHEHGITIETEFFEDDSGFEKTRFGVYRLVDTVTFAGAAAPVEKSEVAA